MPPDGFQFVNPDPATFKAFSDELQAVCKKYGVELLAEARISVKKLVPIASPGVVSPITREELNQNGNENSPG